MSGVLVKTGKGRLLSLLVNAVRQADLVIRLYVNKVDPDDGTVAGDLDEMTTHGYSAKTPAVSNWTVKAGVTTTVTAGEQTWTFEAAPSVEVHGYFVTLSGVLVAAEKFSDGPYPIANKNDQIKLTPTIALT